MLGPGGKVIVGGIAGIAAIVLLWTFVVNPIFLTRSDSKASSNLTAITSDSSTSGTASTTNTSTANTTGTTTKSGNASPNTAVAVSTTANPVVKGQIVDANDGTGVANAVLSAGQTQLATTDTSGNFQISQKLPSGSLTVLAPGYAPLTLDPKDSMTAVKLTANSVSGLLLDGDTKKPLGGMSIKSGDVSTSTDKDGKFTLTRVQDGGTLEIKMPGYAPISQKIDLKATDLTLTAQSTQLNGTLNDSQSGKPVQNALLTMGDATTHPTATGTFSFPDASSGDAKIKVRAPGYRIQTFSVADARKGIKLEPFHFRGVYVPAAYAIRANYNDLFTPYLRMADKGEINSIVVGVKSEFGGTNDSDGLLMYDSQIPFVKQYDMIYGSGKNPAQLIDTQHLLAEAHKHGLYVVARFVVMRDPSLATADAKIAIKDSRSGAAWRDTSSHLTWVNPFSQDIVDYTAALTKELSQMGYDEVQLDYIRFPADAPLRYTDFGNGLKGDFIYDDPATNPKAYDLRTKAIDKIVSATYDTVKNSDTFLSLDVFGVTLWRTDDNNIGQQYNDMVMISDYICPMIYPSHFDAGTLNFPDPGNHPKEIIQQSGKYSALIEAKLQPVARYRPWLEDFDYPWGKYPYKYGPDKVQMQIDTADSTVGETGWTLWNARGSYTESVLAKVATK